MVRNYQENKPVPRRGYIAKLILVFASILFSFLITEMYFRIFDFFPYFSPAEINASEHGDLSEYDSLLGWKGTPGGAEQMTTGNNSVWLQNNSYGFRDIEHDSSGKKPAIVFLGDSFTWGFEIKFNEMFVNLLRHRLKDYEIFNISHRGYSTDQELLTFENFQYDGPIKLVVLMFCENDVESNNINYDDKKYKPKFEVIDDKLVLTGVPVPKVPEWDNAGKVKAVPPKYTLRERAKKLLLKSYFLHYLYFVYKLHFSQNIFSIDYIRAKLHKMSTPHENVIDENNAGASPDLTLTSKILEEMRNKVSRRGARFIIFFIPSKIEIEHLSNAPLYQEEIEGICRQLDITCVDLAPFFKASWRRTYFHDGMHWNKYGNKLAAGAIYNYIAGHPDLLISSKKISRSKGNSRQAVYH
jgi:hypothetical protein